MASVSEPQDHSVPKVLPAASLEGSSDSLPPSFEPGQIVQGRYELIRLMGTGGVGFVVAAHHMGFDDLVALKFLRPEFATNAEAVGRFTIEARASFRLRSEHVVRVMDVDLHEGTPFIAMELLMGTDLRTLLEQRRILPREVAVDYMLQTCEALSAAHAIGVIHRDIKPENLFLLGDNPETHHLKVLDFGISKVALITPDRATHQALTRVAVGTPPYMSPEQVRAAADLDGRSDLWSVGCVLYEALTGSSPFERASLMQSCAAVLEEEPDPARQLQADIPEALNDAIMRCLRKDRDTRWGDVAELAEALAPFGSGRFASYAARCRAHLNGESMAGRHSTPSSLMPVTGARVTGGVAASASAPQAIAVRLGTNLAQRASDPLNLPRVSPAGTTRNVPPVTPEEAAMITAAGIPAVRVQPRGQASLLIAIGAVLGLAAAVAVHLATRDRPARLVSTVQPPAAIVPDADTTLTRTVEPGSRVASPDTSDLPSLSAQAPASDKAASVARTNTRGRTKSARAPLSKPSTHDANAADPDVGF